MENVVFPPVKAGGSVCEEEGVELAVLWTMAWNCDPWILSLR